jgi:iron complex outermembrane receptor protein
MKKMNQIAVASVCFTFGFGLTPVQVAAQSGAEADSNFSLEEVIVTARKREENLQNVPIAIVSLTSEELEKRGVTDVASFAASVPGFAYSEERDRNSAKPGMRGVKAAEIGVNRQKVSSFLDGMPLFGNQSSTAFIDIERLEVYRGPQSSQFGRAVFAGALNYISTPVNMQELSGKLQGTIGNENVQGAGILLTGPILDDRLGFLLAARMDQADGPGSPVSSDGYKLGNQSTKYISSKLEYKATDWMTVTLRNQYLAVDDGPGTQYQLNGEQLNQFVLLPRTIATNTGIIDTRRARTAIGEVDLSPPSTAFDRNFCLEANPALNVVRNCATNPRNDLTRSRSTLDVDFDLADKGTLTISGFYSEDDQNREDQTSRSNILPYRNFVVAPQPPAGTGIVINPYTMQLSAVDVQERFYQALWVSPAAGRLRATAGYSYYNYDFLTLIYSNLATAPTQIISEETVNQGVYGSLQYDLSDSLTLSGEARYQKEVLVARNPLTNLQATQTTKTFLPRYALTYRPMQNISVYAQVAKGNNPAGANVDPLTPIKQQIAARNGTTAELNSYLTYDEETIWNYEVGVKGSLFDRRVTFEAAVYKFDWKGYSIAINNTIADINGFIPGTTTLFSTFNNVAANYNTRVFQNVGDVAGKGFELSTEFIVNRYLSMNLAYAHADSEYVDACLPELVRYGLPLARTVPVQCVSTAGNKLPLIPADTASLAATLNSGSIGGWEWTNRPEAIYQGKQYIDDSNISWLGARTVVNFRSSIQKDRTTWTAYVTNLTDNQDPSTMTQFLNNPYYAQQNLSLGGDGFTLPGSIPVNPRRYGLTVNYNF